MAISPGIVLIIGALILCVTACEISTKLKRFYKYPLPKAQNLRFIFISKPSTLMV
ncbi:MAG: hypothetical protein U5N85_16720 [Arcicella sp.]|nr:hypothetical protein [Arcicella sp.]